MHQSYHNTTIKARLFARADAVAAAAAAGRGLSPAEATDLAGLLRFHAARAARLEDELGALKAKGKRPSRRPVHDAVRRRLLDSLKASGSRLDGASVRSLAAMLGGSKSTVADVLKALLAEGVVRREGRALVLAELPPKLPPN